MITRRATLKALGAMTFAPASAFLPATVRAEDPKIPVVVTFSIIGDFVQVVGGERITLTTIVGPDGDVHVYDPTPADAASIAAAKLVVENGLGLEGWLSRLMQANGVTATKIVASESMTPLRLADDTRDPHAWQSVANAKLYVDNIRDALSIADPLGLAHYGRRAEDYQGKLDQLDKDIRAAIAKIPPERRRIVTTHDAFGYFARQYGLQFLAPAGISTEGEISAANVATVIQQVKTQKIPAVFLENMSDQRMIQRIASESGAKIGGTLYADALSPANGPAATYIAMMRHNVEELVKALA